MEFIPTTNNNFVKPNFTPSQQRAVNDIIQFIANDFDITKNVHALCGAGGVGKTFVTKYIINHSKYASSLFTLTAPTHKACRVLENATNHKVITIQSCFGFRLDADIENFDPNRPEFRPIGPPKISSTNTKVLVIDESSMLNYSLVNYIVKFCAKQGIKVLTIGDASQLPPVNENSSRAFSIAYKINYLTEIVRQEDDNPVSDLLAILRKDIENRTFKFLEYIYKNPKCINEQDKGYTVFNRSDFVEVVKYKFNDPEFTTNIDKYRLVAYTNRAVADWNKIIRQTIILNADKSIINKNDLFMSYVNLADDFNSIILYNSEEYIVRDIANYTDPTYKFKGYMVNLQAIHGGAITKGLFIINHNDPYTLATYCNELDYLKQEARNAKESNRASMWKAYFNFKRKYLTIANITNNLGKIAYSRDVDYGFAITSHRSQGSTYENVFVDINDICYDKNGKPYSNINELLRRLYVACSRTKNNLYLCYG